MTTPPRARSLRGTKKAVRSVVKVVRSIVKAVRGAMNAVRGTVKAVCGALTQQILVLYYRKEFTAELYHWKTDEICQLFCIHISV